MMKVNLQGAVPIDKVSTDNKRQNQAEITAQDLVQKRQRLAHTELSNVSKTAQQTFDTLQNHSDVDLAKVTQIKHAIQNGELQLDQDVLIKTLLDMHK